MFAFNEVILIVDSDVSICVGEYITSAAIDTEFPSPMDTTLLRLEDVGQLTPYCK
jgi:hypothetical protein